MKKTKNNHKKLRELIVELTQRVAQINTLPPETRKIHDVIAFNDEKLGYVVYDIVNESTQMGRSRSWVLTNREEPLWNKVVAELSDLNRKIVSRQTVGKMLRRFIWKYAAKEWSLSGLPQDAEALTTTIANEKGRTARVYLPIWGLVVRTPPFVIGDVAFKPRTEYPEIDKALQSLESTRQLPAPYRIHTIATTESCGDNDMLVQNAEAKVNQALNVFRAFTQRIVQDPSFKQIGVMGSYYTSEKQYFADSDGVSVGESPEIEGYKLSGTQDRVVDQYLTQLHLANTGFDRISEFLISHPSKFEASLLRGAEWLGEATKPDTLESKFLKVAFAVDAMVGEESENVPDRGKKARIAERSAFLLAKKGHERLRIYREMSSFIGKRDELAHGSRQEVRQWETERFGDYARDILITLVRNDQNFKTKEELANWVLKRSFQG